MPAATLGLLDTLKSIEIGGQQCTIFSLDEAPESRWIELAESSESGQVIASYHLRLYAGVRPLGI